MTSNSNLNSTHKRVDQCLTFYDVLFKHIENKTDDVNERMRMVKEMSESLKRLDLKDMIPVRGDEIAICGCGRI